MVRNLPSKQEMGFNPWVGKIPWRRAWQPTPGFLPGEFYGQRSLAATVHRLGKSQTQLKQLSRHTHILYIHVLYMSHASKVMLKILQARILEWVAMPSSRASSQPRD